jgi:hypothetical protein
MHESLQGATFHIEHVIPTARGGNDRPENLAWACPGCNLAKTDQVEAQDPETGQRVPLFSPRKDVWADHFSWNGHEVIARTAVGRATLALLDLNRPRRILIRQAEEHFGLFPPRM